jgi:aspartate kinase
LASDKVIIVAGFQGVSPRTKEITTLGRGGSDLSAIALAASLGAKSCELYKDVDGMMTADPRIVPSARLIKALNFATMTELAWNGASILHPRGAHIASKYGIPFEIRTSLDFDKRGTLIQGHPQGHPQGHQGTPMESPKVTAIAHKTGMCLVECRVKAVKDKAAPLAPALGWLWQQGESPVVSSQHYDPKSGYWLVMALKNDLVDDFLTTLAETAGPVETVRRESSLATITVVGEGFQQSPETVEKAYKVLDGAPLFMETRNTAMTVCLPESALKTTLAALHRELIETH